ncbi:MAG TPA: hypothetical protein VMM76_18350 [Pirellulaceae bacterium]|nr:hypothetical protein [Pirellulaceae bacterium]
MKPGKNDTRYKIRISGTELAVLHKLTWAMAEAYGLDHKIEAYKGTRAITLYDWDLDCLDSVTFCALRDPARHHITSKAELEALARLEARLRELRVADKE